MRRKEYLEAQITMYSAMIHQQQEILKTISQLKRFSSGNYSEREANTTRLLEESKVTLELFKREKKKLEEL